MGKGKGKGTPDDLDYLFERDIVQEEDYVEFWSEYWKRDSRGREQLVNEFLEIAAEGGQEGDVPPENLAGVVTRNKAEAIKQAGIIGGRVVRRDKRGRFSKRGRRYQAIRRNKK